MSGPTEDDRGTTTARCNGTVGAAWCYPDPEDAARAITGRIAFWRGVEIR